MKILSLHQVTKDENQKIWDRSPSLFSYELRFDQSWELIHATDSFIFPTRVS